MTDIKRIGICGVGRALPKAVLTNQHLERLVDTSDEWIQQRTGIQTRRIIGAGESIQSLAVSAARAAIEHSGVNPQLIRHLRVGVNTFLGFPSLGTLIQRELELEELSAVDISAGCSGFIFALEDVCYHIKLDLLERGDEAYGLIVGGDGLSLVADWKDRGTCVLFGDGFGAAVIGPVKSGGILATYTHTQGRYADLLYLDPFMKAPLKDPVTMEMEYFTQTNYPFLRMDGRRLFPVAVRTMMSDIKTVIDKYNRTAERPLTLDDIDYVIPHQANLRIVHAIQEGLKMRPDQVYTDGVINYGNTSAGTIPIAYVDEWGKRPGAIEIDVAFGAGFTSGAVLRQVSED